jgi:hypothetical protein
VSAESSEEAKLQNELLILMKCQLLSGSHLRNTLKLRRLVNWRPIRFLKNGAFDNAMSQYGERSEDGEPAMCTNQF